MFRFEQFILWFYLILFSVSKISKNIKLGLNFKVLIIIYYINFSGLQGFFLLRKHDIFTCEDKFDIFTCEDNNDVVCAITFTKFNCRTNLNSFLCDRNIFDDCSETFDNHRTSSDFGKWSEMFACRYEFYLLVFNSISHSFAALTREISSSTLADKICIHARACNILSILYNCLYIYKTEADYCP